MKDILNGGQFLENVGSGIYLSNSEKIMDAAKEC